MHQRHDQRTCAQKRIGGHYDNCFLGLFDSVRIWSKYVNLYKTTNDEIAHSSFVLSCIDECENYSYFVITTFLREKLRARQKTWKWMKMDKLINFDMPAFSRSHDLFSALSLLLVLRSLSILGAYKQVPLWSTPQGSTVQ